MKKSMKMKVAIVVFCLMAAVACGTDEVVLTIQLVGSGADNALTLYSLFTGKPVNSAAIQLIDAQTSVVIDLYRKFAAASAAAKPDALSQLEAGVATFQGNLQEALGALNVGNEQQQRTINSIVTIVMTEVRSIVNLAQVFHGNAAAKKLSRATRPKGSAQFRVEYNDAMRAAGHPELLLK